VTRNQTLLRFVALALGGAAVTVLLDVSFVALHLGWAAWSADVAYASTLVLASFGCFAPNSPVFGRVIDGTGVVAPVMAITFDDGPSPDTTPRILDALREAGKKATFFVLGRHAEAHPEIVRRIVEEGHEVANHTYSHRILVFASRRTIADELWRTQEVLEACGADHLRYFRAPHGFRNPLVVRTCRRLGYQVVGWTKGVFDTALPGADVIVKRSVAAIRPGAVLLLHDADGNGSGSRAQTADALPAILRAIDDAGLASVTLGELAALAPERRTSWPRVGLVIAIAAVLVTLASERLNRQNLHDTAVMFRSLSLPLVAGALLANLVSVWFKAVVWKASLDTIPGVPRFRYRQVVPAIFVGFLLNSALVARLGEVGRLFVLRRRVFKDVGVTIPMATIAGTLVMEQVILGATLVLVVAAMFLVLPDVPAGAIDSFVTLLAAIGALVLAVVAVQLLSRWRRRRHPEETADEPVARSWGTFLRSAEAVVREMGHGQRLLRDPVRTARSLAGGLVSWVAQVLGIWLTLRAFGITHDALGVAAVVFLASNIIGLIQVTPGNVGSFQLTVASAMSTIYGIDFTTGVAFAIGLQVIEIALGAGLGLVFLSREGLSFGEVRRGISASDDADSP
jgi:peptidoglycan/xylan/chitin deacetylase (PgdA/CDA1 family)/uncharacterized membrane protein YbhN (UPF0104 family)